MAGRPSVGGTRSERVSVRLNAHEVGVIDEVRRATLSSRSEVMRGMFISLIDEFENQPITVPELSPHSATMVVILPAQTAETIKRLAVTAGTSVSGLARYGLERFVRPCIKPEGVQ